MGGVLVPSFFPFRMYTGSSPLSHTVLGADKHLPSGSQAGPKLLKGNHRETFLNVRG